MEFVFVLLAIAIVVLIVIIIKKNNEKKKAKALEEAKKQAEIKRSKEVDEWLAKFGEKPIMIEWLSYAKGICKDLIEKNPYDDQTFDFFAYESRMELGRELGEVYSMAINNWRNLGDPVYYSVLYFDENNLPIIKGTSRQNTFALACATMVKHLLESDGITVSIAKTPRLLQYNYDQDEEKSGYIYRLVFTHTAEKPTW
ncbi:MAG: hypothetical protein IKC87_03320 [Clostridia bacterium]|nr:hypothetical protein [Clostridia bacterium]